jgi:hypothetical protein
MCVKNSPQLIFWPEVTENTQLPYYMAQPMVHFHENLTSQLGNKIKHYICNCTASFGDLLRQSSSIKNVRVSHETVRTYHSQLLKTVHTSC